MKIDPSGKQHPLTSTPGNRPVTGAGTEDDFAKVLDNTVQKTANGAEKPKGGVQPSASPMMTMGITPLSVTDESKTVHGLLNTLEKYQHLLGDPGADLKKVATAVDRMGVLSDEAQALIHRMPEGHPVRTVAQEALIEISKEIERFNSGYYVDG